MSDAVQGQKAQALFHLGIMYFNIHNNDIAKGYFEEICKLTSHHITVQEKKVMAYSKL